MAEPLFDIPAGYDPEAVEASMAAVRAFCGWHIAPVISEDLILDSHGGYLLMLPTLKLVSVDAFTINGEAVLDAEWSQAGIIKNATPSLGWWEHSFRSVAISITHGYETCPAEIRSVVLGVARSGLTSSRVVSQTTGPFSVTYAQGASAPFGIGLYETAILSRYRLPASL